MPVDPFAALGEYITASEADALAVQFETGMHISSALTTVAAARRGKVKGLLLGAGLGHTDAPLTASVLRAIKGSKTGLEHLTAVWTMPGNEANVGHLTSEFHRTVKSARVSVTAATYNFVDSSAMWGALREASEQPGITVTVYVDGRVADGPKVKQQLPRAAVYQSAALPGGWQVVSHAKFVIIDHEFLLLTSANFSKAAEMQNVEFGVLIHDAALADSVETMMTSKRGSLYEAV